jgi:hypothetical protein
VQIINIARNETEQTTEQNKQTSRSTTRKRRKEANTEERIQKANGGGWKWKQWRQEVGNGSSGGRKMESEEVKAGRIDWVSHWFENSRISDETCRPGNERNWSWNDSNCGIGRDSSDESGIASTEMRRWKRRSCNA